MTATFINLATATTSHYQPPGRRILLTTYTSTIDNVYLAHRLLFARYSCHRPTPFRTSSPSHITSSVIATIFIAVNHPACHTNRKILQCCNIEPPFGVNETCRGRITDLHDSKCTNEYTTTRNGGGLKWIQWTTLNKHKQQSTVLNNITICARRMWLLGVNTCNKSHYFTCLIILFFAIINGSTESLKA